jgi:hypothetical protein
MNKKSKRLLCIGISAVILIAAALILFLPGGVLNNPGDDGGQSVHTIRLENYNKVEKGMTYEEVKGILGADGELFGDGGDTSSDSGYLTTYRWYGENDQSVAVMSFLSGKLTAKTQVGIT